MITIFIVLGLAFLIGGVGAIVDGWPYLMIERGFTQVIIGTVGATGGVILLALSRVLAELRRVRTALSAMTLLSAAALPGEAPSRGREERPAPVVEPTPAETDRTGMLGPAVAGAGLAAAGGGFAAALARDDAAREDEAEPSHAPPPPLSPMVPPMLPAARELDEERSEPDTGDLFDDAPPPMPTASDEPRSEGPEPHEADEPPQPEEFHEDPGEEQARLPLVGQAASDEAEPEVEAEDISEPMSGDEPAVPAATEPMQDAPQPAEPAPSMWWPRIDTPRTPAEPERAATDFDDLASLRDHLTRGPKVPESPEEPGIESEEKAPDSDIAAAETWMEPAFGRREPTFAEPSEEPASSTEEEPAEHPAAAQDGPSADQPDAALHDEPAASEETPASGDDTPAPEETPRPAASDEGVVGAYQVGDTHFTMFADGSIRARTPEGEYSFASMEELKAYLASEKSRLGV